MNEPSYGLFTSARNEEGYIGSTLESVLAQTVLPRRWVIVSDSSTDATDRIIQEHSRRNPFIQYIRVNGGDRHDFRSKVRALNIAAAAVLQEEVSYIGNLDADITLRKDYYQLVLGRFAANPRLGIGGGIIREKVRGRYVRQNISRNSVAGGLQLFRRDCFAAVQPYVPMRYGGEDACMEIQARALGWEVRTFEDIEAHHHRAVGGSVGSRLRARYRLGMVLHALGYHPVFEMLRCLARVFDRPAAAASAAELIGFAAAHLDHSAVKLPAELVRYLRREQLARLMRPRLVTGRSHVRHLRSIS
jgi:hypothetical protein